MGDVNRGIEYFMKEKLRSDFHLKLDDPTVILE